MSVGPSGLGFMWPSGTGAPTFSSASSCAGGHEGGQFQTIGNPGLGSVFQQAARREPWGLFLVIAALIAAAGLVLGGLAKRKRRRR